MSLSVIQKPCTKCKVVKPLLDFCKDRAKKDGRQSRCRACEAVYARVARRTPRYMERQRIRARIRRQDPVRQAYMRAYNSMYKKKPEVIAGNRATRIIRQYRITVQKYDLLLEEQSGLCAICGSSPSGMKKRLGIDHNHTTGAIRGLLCSNCNLGIAHFKENRKILEAAIEYLGKAPRIEPSMEVLT